MMTQISLSHKRLIQIQQDLVVVVPHFLLLRLPLPAGILVQRGRNVLERPQYLHLVPLRLLEREQLL